MPSIVYSVLLLLLAHVAPTVACAQELPADARALETEQKMTDEERFSLLVSVMGTNPLLPVRDKRIPEGVPMSAGYVPGIPRLGVPALLMTDASLGITNPGYRPGDTATALPAGLALGASFNPALAREAGAMIGREARSRGFNVQLAGGIVLTRDPRNGRNFEYLSEDPLLSATIAAESINGIQGEAVISTRSSTTRSTATRRIGTGWTRSSILPRTASPTCSHFKSRSSVPIRAPS